MKRLQGWSKAEGDKQITGGVFIPWIPSVIIENINLLRYKINELSSLYHQRIQQDMAKCANARVHLRESTETQKLTGKAEVGD